jgi:iron complex transport system ATP-binding protein
MVSYLPNRIRVFYNHLDMSSLKIRKGTEESEAAVIRLKGVSWIVDGTAILRDMNWTVDKREHWAVIGLNGSGKTSLLNMVNGYIWPSEGEISVLGKRFGRFDVRELRKKIGWASSSLQEKFYAGETAEEIVMSGRFATIGLYDEPRKNDKERAGALLELFQCGYTAKQQYWSLSQGEKQKVLIARALIHNPRLLILDEPCAGLDIISREKILSLIQTIGSQKSGPSILFVSHHIEEILPVFSHVLLLRRGQVHSQGKTREVLTKKNLRGFFERNVDVRWRKGRACLYI